MSDNFLWVDCKRCVFSVRFLLIVAAIAVICLTGCASTFSTAIQNPNSDIYSSLDELELLLTFDKYKCVMTAALAALYAGSFTEDRKNNYLRCVLSRISLQKYVVCRLMVILIGCVVATVAGFGLMSLILSNWMGLRVVDESIVAMRFLQLASGNFAFLYLILLGVNFGIAAAIAAVIGMWMTVYREERFLAVGGAVLAFYFLYAISILLPDILSYEAIGSRFNQSEFAANIGVVLYHLLFLVLLFCGTGMLFYGAVKRRWNRGQLV